MRYLEFFCMRRWESCCLQLQRDFKLWICAILMLTSYRIAMLVMFQDQLQSESNLFHQLVPMRVGLLFDMKTSTCWILPCILMSVLCGYVKLETLANGLRASTAGLFFLTTAVLSSANLEYFREFGDNFNTLMFNAWYDNQAAILSTAWEEYHLLAHLIISAGVSLAMFFLWRKFGGLPLLTDQTILRYTPGQGSRLVVGVVLTAAVVLSIRGSLSHKPLSNGHAFCSMDPLLNKVAFNPYISLQYATRSYLKTIGGQGLKTHLPDENIAAAVRKLYPEAPVDTNLDRILQRHAAGPPNEPPRHILMLGMESYDSWPLLEKYRCLGLAEQLQGIAAKGLHIKAFLPSGEMSVCFLNTVISGLPEAGVFPNWEEFDRPLATSLPETMRRLGYRTRFFCGAPNDWQNCHNFCLSQGFDEVYGALDVIKGTGSQEVPNLWAAPDAMLWDFVASKIQDDEPSFTFVFTSSFHSPYDIDLEKEGCPLKQVPTELEQQWTKPRARQLHRLGHLWYADRELGQFVHQMEQRLSRPLFAITGDHFGRNFINDQPTPYERSSVPFILYGKEVLENVVLPPRVAGGHIDIPATLIELAAPRGFSYQAMGNNLLAPHSNFFGYGPAGRIICHDTIMQAEEPEVLHPIPGRALPPFLPDVPAFAEYASSARAVSWWRTKQGTELPAPLPLVQPDLVMANGQSIPRRDTEKPTRY